MHPGTAHARLLSCGQSCLTRAPAYLHACGAHAYCCHVLLMQVSGSRPVIPPQVPPELADIIRACWAQKPEDRPTFPDVLVRLDSAMGVIGGPQATTLSWETTREWP